MAQNKMYVRLKPFNKKRGHVLRRYSYRGVRFYEGRWYKVPEKLAQELGEVRQRHGDIDSPYAFDVATQEQARKIEDEEQRRKEEELRKVQNAEVVGATEVRESNVRGSLTTADIADDDRDLGVTMRNTKDELVDVAESMGIDTEGMTKKQVFEAIEEAARD